MKVYKVYFFRTDADNNVAITDGNRVKIFNGAPTGIYDGIDLYSDTAADDLRNHFAEMAENGELADYDDIFAENEIEYADFMADVDAGKIDAVIVFDR